MLNVTANYLDRQWCTPRVAESAERLLWAGALIAICTFAASVHSRAETSHRAIVDFDTAVAGPARPAVAPPASENESTQRVPTIPARPSGTDAEALLHIPSLDLIAPLRTGADKETLAAFVGRHPYAAGFGEGGNVVLAGHRDTHFRNLGQLRPGDEVVVRARNARWHYVVESYRIAEPRDVGILEPTTSPSLTLITCYPFNFVGPAPQRYVVRARLRATERYSNHR